MITCEVTTLIEAIVAPGASGSSFWSVGVEMARKEGVLSLTGGLSASMLRELVYSGIRMGTYEFFKDKYVCHHTRDSLLMSTNDRISAGCTQRQKVH